MSDGQEDSETSTIVGGEANGPDSSGTPDRGVPSRSVDQVDPGLGVERVGSGDIPDSSGSPGATSAPDGATESPGAEQPGTLAPDPADFDQATAAPPAPPVLPVPPQPPSAPFGPPAMSGTFPAEVPADPVPPSRTGSAGMSQPGLPPSPVPASADTGSTPAGPTRPVAPVDGPDQTALFDPAATVQMASVASRAPVPPTPPPTPPPSAGDDPAATQLIVVPPTVDPTGQMPSPATATANALSGPGTPGFGDPATTSEVVRPRPRRRRRLLMGALAVVLVLIAVVAAWGVDQARNQDVVMRGVRLDDTPIGGLDRPGLENVLTELDAALSEVEVEVAIGEAELTTDAAALGARLDRERIIDTALQARRNASPLLRPIQWLTSFFTTEVLEPVYVMDDGTARDATEQIIAPALDQPVDPDIILEGSTLVVTAGSSGITVDADQLIESLPAELEADEPHRIELEPVTADPAYSDEAVQDVADEASELTVDPVQFRVLDESTEVSSDLLRSWIRLDDSGDEPGWTIDERQALADLKPLFPTLGSEDQRARFSVVDGEPIIIPASETVICCTAESVAGIAEVIRETPPAPVDNAGDDGSGDGEEAPVLRLVTLEPEIVGSDEGVAELASLGIEEEVSSFTTEHPCCAPRVTNIHRFADLVRGVVIRPGEDFSLNEHVGQRTIEKGFVADSAIADGVLEPQVGGGVSQFATTFFNAAFFAGIDFNVYQSHSLYISRYPRGREATISWRKPDLSVKNTTDYGILVWPTYTDTSITVTFYSTRHIEVESGDPVSSPQGRCTRWTTARTRTYPDGIVVEDSVFALYRPGEGLDCNGNSTRPDRDTPEGPTLNPDDALPPTSPAPQPGAPQTSPAPQPADPQPVPASSDPGATPPIVGPPG